MQKLDKIKEQQTDLILITIDLQHKTNNQMKDYKLLEKK